MGRRLGIMARMEDVRVPLKAALESARYGLAQAGEAGRNSGRAKGGTAQTIRGWREGPAGLAGPWRMMGSRIAAGGMPARMERRGPL